MAFQIGTDPEFILIDEKNNLKSAIQIIKCGKNKKIKINKSTFFYDNVLAECSVFPSNNSDQFINNIRESLIELSKIIKPFKLSNLCSGNFSEEEMNHKDSRIAGCETEYCAYLLKSINNKKIKNLFKKSNFRTAGGHIHLGTDLGKEDISCVMLIRMLDLFLGTTCLLLENENHYFERRKIYGQPGRYRQPSYGVEYRTPSNFWLMSPKLVDLVYDICSFCVNFVKDKKYEFFWKIDTCKLESDSFWNNGGDPSSCHACHGYNVKNLIKLYEMDKNKIKKQIESIKKITDYYFTTDINKKISKLSEKKFDLYKEWDL